jgi:hypothetical protein
MRRLLLSLLTTSLLGCDQSPQPTGPAASRADDPGSVSAARAKARQLSVSRERFQLRQLGAGADFSSVEGCILTDVFLTGAQEVVKTGPGKPAAGPFAFVGVFVVDLCTDELLRDIGGDTDQATFSADKVKLSQARLQATVPAFDFVNEEEVQVTVDVAWTGFGSPFVQVSNNHIRQGGFRLHERFRGTFRDAEATGTVSVDGQTVASGTSAFADVFKLKVGDMVLERIR